MISIFVKKYFRNNTLQGFEYVMQNFTMLNVHAGVSVFEATIRFLGGLLAAHALTKEIIYVYIILQFF